MAEKEPYRKIHPRIHADAAFRALLDGWKTMTRRPVKPQPTGDWKIQCLYLDTHETAVCLVLKFKGAG
ncbi:MAG: hypothetical protein OEY97_07675 [Nitrospirota bacterium]|nr:hypothetical protein [Nitrospirota bacterium]